MSKYLPEGWTQEKIDETLDFQREQKLFCCRICGWMKGKCKHRKYGEINRSNCYGKSSQSNS